MLFSQMLFNRSRAIKRAKRQHLVCVKDSERNVYYAGVLKKGTYSIEKSNGEKFFYAIGSYVEFIDGLFIPTENARIINETLP